MDIYWLLMGTFILVGNLFLLIEKRTEKKLVHYFAIAIGLLMAILAVRG